MWKNLGRLRSSLLTLCVASALCAACGSSDDGAASADTVLSEAPHCPAGADSLKIEGTVAGGAIDDTRTTNINAAYQNIGAPQFQTPIAAGTLEANQLALTLTWKDALFDGQTGAATGGTLTLPANHPQAGATFCVSQGEVGFVGGGSEDAAFKFAVTELRSGADCSGAATAVDLRGCYNSQ